ncbi:MAG: LysR family transcriptional regulator [Rhodoferax sp.]|uniref:LysR family transcriptional regulator n=1 Tax=Rhodoferax sp. TaxID=50421 RepID=UPI0027250933|nr:LysR family transcriptional regulator [Rhodoferax sp.]MDO8449669.1 LysR family transcriptional regulator [Rhodoferax sp.]
MQVKSRAALGQLSDMDIRLLRVFKSVVECGGMAAAELELNIGTSTVSRHIKDLETRVGLTLCRRGRAGFALTTEGEQIYTETLRLLAGVDAFRGSVDEIHRRMGGQLNIAVFDKTASNPAAHIGAAIALFSDVAPEVSLHLHVAPLNTIERGVIDGQFQVGVIPGHRSSETLAYDELFTETMFLYCGARHALFKAEPADMTWDDMRAHHFAGLGYHSPNMEISQQLRLPRKATGYDQESIATLILSGRYLGFLPDHYAEGFVRNGQMRAVKPALFRYDCSFFSIVRRSPQPSRVTRAFQECLVQAHKSIDQTAGLYNK